MGDSSTIDAESAGGAFVELGVVCEPRAVDKLTRGVCGGVVSVVSVVSATLHSRAQGRGNMSAPACV